MNRITLALAVFTAATSLALSASANNINAEKAQYNNQPNSQRGMTDDRYQNQHDGRQYNSMNPSSGTQRHARADRQDESNCIKSGWMDNEDLQHWRAKNPGRTVCFSSEPGSTTPEYAN